MLDPSGESRLIAPESVRWDTCSGPVPADISFDRPSDPEPLPVTALSLGSGDDCVIAGRGDGSDFRALPGQACTLHFPEGPRRLRVEAFWVAPRQAFGDGAQLLTISLRGVDAASGRYALYHFDGRDAEEEPASRDPCPKLAAAGLVRAVAR